MASYNLTVQLNLQGPRNLNSVVNNINQRLNNIQATVNVQTSPQTAQALQRIASASQSVQQSANGATNSMEQFGRSAGLAIKRFAAFTAVTAGFYAVTRATTQSLERFIEYDRQLTRIAQVTGNTKDSLGGLSNTITQLSVSLGASSSSLAQIAVTLSQAGLTAKETEQALKALALTTLAASFDDINQTVEGSIALMRQFSISTTDLGKALGSINAVAAGFAVEAGDIISAIQRAGGVFAAASNGVSQGTDALNEFIAVFTSVRATTRESAETIATGLRTIFSRLQREDTVEALKEFGVELTDLEGKFIGPFRAIEQLAGALGTLDPRDLRFSAIVEELGGFRQVGKVIPLIQQFATAQQALSVAQRGSGSLAADAALGQQALGVQIAKVQQEFDALIRSVGQTKEFQQFIRLSLDLASALIQVADAVKPLAPALAALGVVGLARGIPSIARGFSRGIGATGYSYGGLVPGSGSGDTHRAMLEPGEFVIRKKAVQSLGVDRLSDINKYGRGGSVQRFEKGGMSNKKEYKSIKTDEHFAHLDAGPNVYKDDRYWGKGLSALGVMLPEKWNTDFARGNANVSGLQLKDYINNQNIEQTFARQLGTPSKKHSGQTGSFVGGQQNPVYDLFAKSENMKSLKTAVLNAIDPQKIYRSNADLFPVGQNMLAVAKAISPVMAKELSVVRKVQLTAESPLGELGRQAGDYDTITDKSVGGTKLSFRQDRRPKDQKFPTRYSRGKRLQSGGPVNEVEALLTPGEFVINKDAASSLGRSTLNRLNNADRLPKYHSGGAVGYIGGVQRFAAGGAVDDNRRGVGSTIGLAFALQSAAGLFATSIEEASSEGAARMGGSIQGAVSGLNFGLIGGEIAGFIPGLGKLAGPIGLLSGAALAAAESYIRAENAAIAFANKLDKQKIDESANKISRSFEILAKDANNLGAINDIIGGVRDTTRATNDQRNREIGTTRLSYGNLAENLFGYGVGAMTTQQVGAGTSEQTLAAQRSLVLEMKGFSAYLNTLGRFVGDDEIAQKNLADEIRNINRSRAVDSSKEFASIANPAIGLIEQRLKEGVDLEDILDTPAFKSFSEALARSNPEVERFILNTQANTSITQEEKDARIANVIATRAEIEARQRTIGVRKQLEIDSAKSAGRSLETVLSRVFQNMEQAFNATATEIAQNFDKIDLDIKALSGKASIGVGQNVSKSILENPRAYSSNQLTGVVNSLKPLLGDQANLIGNMAIASTDIEGKILSSINSAIKENPDANPTAIAGIVSRDIKNIVSSLGLPPDLANILSQQITAGIEGLRAKGKDKIALDTNDVRSSIVGFADTIDSLSGSMKVLNDAQSLYRSAIESYVGVSNSISDLLVSRNEYLQKSFDILSNSALSLDEAFGRIVGAPDLSRQQSRSVENLTGGISDPNQIFNRIIDLNTQRGRLQSISESKQDPVNVDQFIQLTTLLTSTNVELNIMQQALRSVAESSMVADAALSDIAKQQEKRQQQAGFLEQLVSSTPEQIQSLNQAYNDLQRLLGGQANTIYTSIEAQKAYIETLRSTRNPFEAEKASQGVLSQERGNVLSLVKEMGPFMGNSQQANNMRADVLGAQLSQLGMLTPQFTQILESVRNPERDPDVQQSIALHRESVQKQILANILLAKISEANAISAKENSAKSIADAIAGVRLTLSAESAQDIARGIQPVQAPVAAVTKASGGVIYAAQGQMVNMMPQGTDTVPAMLTPGEFVVNRAATQQNRGLLENINSGKTKYYQYGGFVSPSFDGGQSRQKASQPLAPIEEWENWSKGFERVDKSLFTAKNFVKFGGKNLDVREILPQDILSTTIENTDRLKQLIYSNFSENKDIFPGKVSDLVVERIGAYDPKVGDLGANLPNGPSEPKQVRPDYGTASRIASSAKKLGLINTQYPSVRDIPKDRYEEVARGAGITREALLQYVKTYISKDKRTGSYDEEKAAERLSIYAAPYNKNSIVTQINPGEAGLYGVSIGDVPRMDVNSKELTEKDFGMYKLNFNRLTSFIDKPPADLPIVDGLPEGKPWNISDGKYHNLYESFGAPTPFGINVNRIKTPVLKGWGISGSEPGHYFDVPQTFRLSDSGNSGEVLSGKPYSKSYKDLKNSSNQIFELVQQHKDTLNSGLADDPQIGEFTKALFNLYSGAESTKDLSQFSRFFRNKTPMIQGLSSEAFRVYRQKAVETNDAKKFPFGEEWVLANFGVPKKLGILREQEEVDKLKELKDDIIESEQEAEKDFFKITPVLDSAKQIQVPIPRDRQQQLGSRSLPIDIPTPHNIYQGNLYDEQIGDYTNKKIDKGIPLYKNYDSFLNNKSTNDLMYSNLQNYQDSIARKLNRTAISNYLFNDVPYDPKIDLQSPGYFGSDTKPNIYQWDKGLVNQGRTFSIMPELTPAIDKEKAKVFQTEEFVNPEDRTTDDNIIVGRFNDMMVDAIRYWGGIRGPLASTINSVGITQTQDVSKARAGSQSIAAMFLKEKYELGKPLGYKSLASGFSDAFANINSGKLDAFTTKRGRQINVDTVGAALSFGQRHWLDQSGDGAPNLELPANQNFINDAVKAVENNPQIPTTFGGLFDLFLNPYNKYNEKNTRSRGLKTIFNEMTAQRYYERNRRGPIPSASEAEKYYNDLLTWYGGGRDGIGQDGISEEISGLRNPIEKARKFSAYTLSKQKYNKSNNSHVSLGGGIYGPLPNLTDIARINGVNPAMVRRDPMIRAQPLEEGGIALLNKALQDQKIQEEEQAKTNRSGESKQTEPVTSDQFNSETLTDIFKRFGASEGGLRQLSEDQKRKRNVTGPDPLFDVSVGANANVGDAVKNIPGMASDIMGAAGGALTMLPTAPGAIAEQAMNNLLGTDSRFMTDIYQYGLSNASKPGERLATGIYSPETMNLPGSYAAGASQENIMQNMSGGSAIASTILDLATGFDPSDIAKIPKMASLAGLPALFPTFTRAAKDMAGGYSQAAAQKKASTIYRNLAKRVKKGIASETQIEDLRIWKGAAASGLESDILGRNILNEYPPEIREIIDKYSSTPIFQPQAKASSTPTTATVRLDIQEQAAEQQVSSFQGIGLEADRSPKPLQGVAPQQTQRSTGRYVVDPDLDPADMIRRARTTSTAAPTTATRASQAATQQSGQKQFRFTAIDAATGVNRSSSRNIGDTIEAANEAEAQATIRSMGYMVTTIKEGAPSLLERIKDRALSTLGFGEEFFKADPANIAKRVGTSATVVPTTTKQTALAQSLNPSATTTPKQTALAQSLGATPQSPIDMAKEAENARTYATVSDMLDRKAIRLPKGITYDQISKDPELKKKILDKAFERLRDKEAADFYNTYGYSSGGVVKPKYLSNGGSLVNFAPKGTDTVPAMLTPGEFVVNAQATKNNMGLLQSINSKGMSSGGVAKKNYLNRGGVATAELAPDGDWANFATTYHPGTTYRPWRRGGSEGASVESTDLATWKMGNLERMYGWMQNGSPFEQEMYRKMHFAIQKGAGRDALGRSVYNNPTTKYTDPMSNVIDDELIYGEGRNLPYGQPGMSGGSVSLPYGYSGGYSDRARYNRGGMVSPKYLVNGGQLANYAPRGTDTVPAMLTPGEFVVNKQSTSKNRGLLESINAGKTQYYQRGGEVSEYEKEMQRIRQSYLDEKTRKRSSFYENRTQTPISEQKVVQQQNGGMAPVTQQQNGALQGGAVVDAQPIVEASALLASTLSTTFNEFVVKFGTSTTPLISSIQTLSAVDFGVINTGAQSLLTASQNLGRHFTRFDTAVSNFSDKTNKFINSINNLKLDGTINVQGSITMQPLTVNIAGLEVIETRIKGIGPAIASSIASALREDNPGMNVTALQASTTLY